MAPFREIDLSGWTGFIRVLLNPSKEPGNGILLMRTRGKRHSRATKQTKAYETTSDNDYRLHNHKKNNWVQLQREAFRE